MQLNLRNLESSTLSFSTSFDAWICSDVWKCKRLHEPIGGSWKDVFVLEQPEQFFIRCMMMTLGFAN